jgi:hypothetical protein
LGLSSLHAARDPQNTVWVAFQTPRGDGNSGIMVVDVPPGNRSPGEPLQLTGESEGSSPFVFVDNSDNIWVFWHVRYSQDIPAIRYRRFLREGMRWEDAPQGTPVPVTTGGKGGVNPDKIAVSDVEGGIWLFWTYDRDSGKYIWCTRWNPVKAMWGEPRQITKALGADELRFVLRGPDDSFWLFWHRDTLLPILIFRPMYRQIYLSI